MASRSNHSARRAALAATAAETRTVLPSIIQQLPHLAPSKSECLHLDYLPPLKAADRPRHNPSDTVTIKVVNDDTFNAAIALAAQAGPDAGRVVVLNMASHVHPGGGWLKGASAQEEALCYRSSLSLSLHKRYYPFKQLTGVYSPDVVIIRSDRANGHNLLVPDVPATDLPVVSVVSVAALRKPATETTTVTLDDGKEETRTVFAKAEDRAMTKEKMRLCLRMAASRGHGLLVLGALGCGAFGNPPEEVAACWLEVLHDTEFSGGWWREIWFAIFDGRNEGNFEIFERVLGEQEV